MAAGIGEFGDIIPLPISAIIFYRTFAGHKGAFGEAFNVIENFARY
jgi:hypothetical protein